MSAAKLQTPAVPAVVHNDSFADCLTVEHGVYEDAKLTLEYSEYSLFSYSWKQAPVVEGNPRTVVTGLTPNTRYAFRVTITNGSSTATSGISAWFTTLTDAEDKKKRAALVDVVPASVPPELLESLCRDPVSASGEGPTASSDGVDESKTEEKVEEPEVSLEDAHKAATAKITELESLLKKQEVEHITAVDRLKRDLATVRAENTQIQTLNAQTTDLSKKLRTEKDKVADLEAALRAAESKLDTSSKGFANEKAALVQQHAAESEGLQQAVTSLQSQAAMLQKMLDSTSTQGSALEERTSALMAELTAQRSQAGMALEENTVLKVTTSKLEKEKADAEAQCSALRAEVDTLRSALSTSQRNLSSSEDRVVALTSERDALQGELSAAKALSADSAAEAAALKEELAALQSVVVAITQQLETLQTAAERAKRLDGEFQVLSEAKTKADARALLLETQVTELRTRLNATATQLDVTTAKAEAARKHAAESNAEVVRLLAELNTVTASGSGGAGSSGRCANCDRLSGENAKLSADLVDYHLKPHFTKTESTAANVPKAVQDCMSLRLMGFPLDKAIHAVVSAPTDGPRQVELCLQ